MNSQHLEAFIANATSEMQDLAGPLSRGEAGLGDALWFGTLCRIRGIGSLLLEGDPDALHRELSRSGRALFTALPGAKEAEVATSRLSPFFDCVAATDWEGAAGIAARARPSWNPQEEYEEDFLYVAFLMNLFFLGAAEEQCESLLRSAREVLQEAQDVRLDLCEALLHRDQKRFDSAIAGFLGQYLERLRELVRGWAVSQEIEATEAHVTVEGLALLRLAERRGLAVQRDYPGVPSLALKKPGVRYGADLLARIP